MQADELVSNRIELFRPHGANDGILLDDKDPAHQPANEIKRLLDQHDRKLCLVTQRCQYQICSGASWVELFQGRLSGGVAGMPLKPPSAALPIL